MTIVFTITLLISFVYASINETFAQSSEITGYQGNIVSEETLQNTQEDNYQADPNTTSLTFGSMSTWYGRVPLRVYKKHVSASTYKYTHNVKTLMFSSDLTRFSLGYGSRAGSTSETDHPTQRLFEMYFTFGGNSDIYQVDYNSGNNQFPLSIFIPIRFNVQYRNLSLTGKYRSPAGSIVDVENQKTPSLNYGRAGLGAGLGLKAGVPMPFLNMKNPLILLADYQIIPGLFDDLSHKGNTYMGRNKNINVELKLGQFMGGDIGFSIGYTQRAQFRAIDIPGNFGGVISGIIGDVDFYRMGSQHMFRIGINY